MEQGEESLFPWGHHQEGAVQDTMFGKGGHGGPSKTRGSADHLRWVKEVRKWSRLPPPSWVTAPGSPHLSFRSRAGKRGRQELPNRSWSPDVRQTDRRALREAQSTHL